ncbi:MAG: hypothetical protein ABI551_07790 [Polyangiaceae bacterium]
MALISGMVACSGDDDNNAQPGVDSGTPDTSVTPPTDSGPGKDGSTPDSGPPVACATCSQILAKGLAAAGTPCAQSLPIVLSLVDCTCKADPITHVATDGGACDNDSGTGECGDLCTTPTTVPSSACQVCAATNCKPQIAACAADGADAGTLDAGDGGDGAP